VYQLKEVLEPNSSTAEPSPRSPAASGSSMQGSVLLRSAVDELEQVTGSGAAAEGERSGYMIGCSSPFGPICGNKVFSSFRVQKKIIMTSVSVHHCFLF